MRITLVAPWLARFNPRWFEQSDALCPTPALDRWLRFSQVESSAVDGALSTLPLRFFGVDTSPDEDAPYGALSYLGDGGRDVDGSWVRVDPVHLRPDMARLLLFAAPDFEISTAHSQALGRIVREALADWGELDLRHPERWYLRLAERPSVATTPLPAIVGEDVQNTLPAGAQGALWRARLNEIQMQLFDSPTNQEREQLGLSTINGVWLWGVGELPPMSATAYQSLYSRSPVVRGLGLRSGIAWVAASASAIDWSQPDLSPGSHLVWLDPPNPRMVGDPAAWENWRGNLEQAWAIPLVSGVERGRIERITLHPGDGTARSLTKRSLRRFWRTSKPLPRHITSRQGESR